MLKHNGREGSHTFWPAIRQRDSVDTAWDRRSEVSRIREMCVSKSDCLKLHVSRTGSRPLARLT